MKVAPRQPITQRFSMRSSIVASAPEIELDGPLEDGLIVINVLDAQENRLRGRHHRGDEVRWKSLREAAARSRAAAARPKDASNHLPISKAVASRRLDQFYTRGKFAARYLARVAKRYDLSSCLLVEPSAGGGAFYGPMPINAIAFDVEPKYPGILTADFLTFELRSGRRIITVGNPPFGRNASLAVRFFNHAARQSDVIAMIFPRSFLKAAIENRLDRSFHRVRCEKVPPGAFELDGKCRDVAAVFQIWERRAVMRALRPRELNHPDFTFSDPSDFDFIIRRVGANAGEISHDPNVHEDSHYFIKGDVEHIMRQLDLAGAARKATSTPSLARSELVALYRRHVKGSRRRQHLSATTQASQGGEAAGVGDLRD